MYKCMSIASTRVEANFKQQHLSCNPFLVNALRPGAFAQATDAGQMAFRGGAEFVPLDLAEQQRTCG